MVLTLTCACMNTQTDEILLAKDVPFTKSSVEHEGTASGASTRPDYYDDDDETLDDGDNGDNGDNGDTIDNPAPSEERKSALPKLEMTDMIYEPARWGNPLVVKEYKLVFFTIPKVACTEWKLLFRRMLGLPEWDPNVPLQQLHDPLKNSLTYLSNYTIEEAQEMLTSDEWTRSVFVREPKERVLSAFLNKFIEEEQFFIQKCCQDKFFNTKEEKQQCRDKKHEGDFIYFLNRTLDCPNPHWTPQTDAIDSKWWPSMNFVGYMDQVAPDAERLLRRIKSSKKNGASASAWDDYGKTGWGKNGTGAFMYRDTAHHATNAHDKLRLYYTSRCAEAFVERHWASEWNQTVFSFEKFHLYNDTDVHDSDCDIH